VSTETSTGRTAVTNVRVFDGEGLSEPRTVLIDGEKIGTAGGDAAEFDGAGGVLLPGLIDAHIHLHGRDTLEKLCAHGVTTGLDMATWPPERLAELRGVPGLTDIRSPGLPAIGPGGMHAKVLGLPAEAIVLDAGQARAFVAARVAEGADYLKIVAEAPGQGGPNRSTMDTLVAEAHARGLSVVAHAASVGAYTMVLDAGADRITHVPLDDLVAEADVARMTGKVAIPTLTMAESIASFRPGADFAAATASVTALYEAGVPILAGTDATEHAGLPFAVRPGESLHRELELLVQAGVSPAAALRAATSLPARHFGLADRGAIEPGLRADLVLIDGDPLADIRATRSIRRVWCGGVAHEPA
jgi:imidazolonepropionase-like amidohydrolase